MSETQILREITVRRHFDVPAAVVFRAWTDPEHLEWFLNPEQPRPAQPIEVDLRVGGAVRVLMRDPHKDAEYGGGGVYTEIEPPTRLAFTWTWDEEPERETLIEVDFSESEGVTTVGFTHTGLWDEETVRSHEDGWGKAFDNLERALG